MLAGFVVVGEDRAIDAEFGHGFLVVEAKVSSSPCYVNQIVPVGSTKGGGRAANYRTNKEDRLLHYRIYH
jgi:hypothetical protein